jgi:hypothetical protein
MKGEISALAGHLLHIRGGGWEALALMPRPDVIRGLLRVAGADGRPPLARVAIAKRLRFGLAFAYFAEDGLVLVDEPWAVLRPLAEVCRPSATMPQRRLPRRMIRAKR